MISGRRDEYSPPTCDMLDKHGRWILDPKPAGEILAAYVDAKFSTEEDYRQRVCELTEMEKKR